ncbi:ArsC family reductase [Sphingorhabdus sp. IMCC26285]|jgi:arsenate reductase|uniref:ArsC family reductase n=1 Tax=Sphingorhabdus profundilacus TaxID=2509718 RepID=A0A6I4M1F1_9SPHN|nr:ArsC family reductase [Sphingorhabdus profundilacus]MVZ98173.1 ArsC family reductase [Sphingorhabdus profundilacus]
MTITLYGIPNCDTVKKARQYLGDRGIAFHFHDYKKDGIAIETLERWIEQVGWEKLLNKAGTTFKKLADADKIGIDTDKAIALMQANPSMIKRPVVEGGPNLLVGFNPEIYDREEL